jgi:hypothetical protein
MSISSITSEHDHRAFGIPEASFRISWRIEDATIDGGVNPSRLTR